MTTLKLDIFLLQKPFFFTLGYCLETMDIQSGLLSNVDGSDLVLVERTTGYITLTDLPITNNQAERPSLDSEFNRRVIVRAFILRLLSPTSSTTPSGAGKEPTSVKVTVAFLTKKPGDTNFSPVFDGVSPLEKVRTK